MKSLKKLVCIDGNSIFFRAFFALPPLTNQQGQHTNAVYGFTMMLMKILEEQQPTHILVAMDKGKITFRHETYADYKGKREKTPNELSEQFPLLAEILDAFQIRHLGVDNYEADDIIGTLSLEAEQEDFQTVVISGDKDLLQLISPQTEVHLTRKGVTEMERYDVEQLHKRFGLEPKQIIDLKGLMGDSSDHIPGIPGIGEKTALKLLKQFPTVEEVLAHVDQLPGKKLQERVRENEDLARVSKQLATIYREVPLSLRLQDCQYQQPDSKQLAEVFQKLGFKTLLERLQTENEDTFPNTDVSDVSFTIIAQEDCHLYDSFFQTTPLSFWAEIDQENPHRAELIGFCLSNGEKQLYFERSTAQNWSAFQQWLANDQQAKILFDQKKQYVALQRFGFVLAGVQDDLLLSAYLLNPSESHPNMSGIVSQYLQGEILRTDEEVYGKGAKRQQLHGEALATHLANKTHYIFQLQSELQSEIVDKNLSIVYEMEMELSQILAVMELHGVKVDETRLHSLAKELKRTIQLLHDEIIEIAGVDFNINSPKQLGEVLFDKLGLPVIKKTKTGFSTSADVLEKLAPQHEIVEKILHFRQVGKLHSTYIEGLRKEMTKQQKIHTLFHQTIAATGRLSSSEPNLQNIPIRMEEGRRIRQIFVPEYKGNVILSADYSQVELRVLAHLSQDPDLIKAFRENLDIHTQTAMDVFEVSIDEVTELMRRHAKAVNFGIVYGISDYGLSQNLNITRKEAKEIIERYFRTYPQVKKFMDQTIADARESGYVTTLLGRIRYLPDIRSRNFNLRGFAERTAMNTPIQGTAADIIKKAMIALDEEIKGQQLSSRMLLQVHDELIFEVPKEELDIMKKIVHEKMEVVIPDFSIRLHVDIHIGDNWYQAK